VDRCTGLGRGFIDNKHATDVKSPPPPPGDIKNKPSKMLNLLLLLRGFIENKHSTDTESTNRVWPS